MASSPVVLGFGWVVAHHSGSGWVQVLGELVFGALVVGIVGPALILARTSVRLVTAPADAVAGRRSELQLVASTRVRIRPVEPPGPVTFARGQQDAREGPGTVVAFVAPRRGVHHRVVLEVATAAPFAIQWWARRVVIPLPAPLHVAPNPRPGRVSRPPSTTADGPLRAATQRRGLGEPRSARPYAPGDRRQLVHWPLSAHRGDLMVREQEGDADDRVRVVVTLPADPDAAERVAGECLGAVSSLLDAGEEVVLVTREAEGWREGPVGDRRQAGRRLATAVNGP